MATPDELMRSVDAFHALTAQARHWVGSSPIAELLLLEILIARYPEQARQKIADYDTQHRSRLSPIGGDDAAPAQPAGYLT